MPLDPQSNEPVFGEVLADQDLVDYFFDCLERSKEWFDPIWDEAKRLWKVYGGKSFSETDVRNMKDTKRPLIDPPFAAGIIDTVKGAEIAQEIEPIFKGVDEGVEDEVIGEWLTTLARKGMARCKLPRHMLDAYKSKLIGGYGFVEQAIDLEKVPIRPVGKYLRYWMVYPDPDALEENLADADYFSIEERWKMDAAVARWPEKERELKAAFGTGNLSGALPTTAQKSGARTGKTSRRGVEIFRFYYRRKMDLAKWADPETGEQRKGLKSEFLAQKKEIDEANEQALEAYAADLEAWNGQAILAQASLVDPLAAPALDPGPQPQPPQLRPALSEEDAYFWRGDCYYRAWICGKNADKGAVLENEKLDLDEFPVKCETGFPVEDGDEERVRYQGLMYKIADLQEWYTRAIQLYLELQARKVKGGGLIPKSAFGGNQGEIDKFIKNSSTPGMWHVVDDTTGIVANQPVSGEPGVAEIFRTMMEMMGLVTGVTQALQGTFTQDRSNVFVTNQQQQGLQMLAPIREPRKALIKECGRLYVLLATKYLPAEELDRILGVQRVEGMTVQKVPGPDGVEVEQPILGEDGEPVTAGKILKNADLFDYDVHVDVGVATLSQKMDLFQLWNQHGALDSLKEMLPPEYWLSYFLEALPLPGTTVKNIAAGADAYFAQQKALNSQQGLTQALMQMVQSDPSAASGIIQQAMQMMQAGQQQTPPAGAEGQPA